MGNFSGHGYAAAMPVHKVCVDDFYIGRYPVTQAQWQAVMGNNPAVHKECGGNCPVEGVSWMDTQTFIKSLNSLTNKTYRLPTEAEWEYAARSGGKNERWPGTNDEEKLYDYAWVQENSDHQVHSIGTRLPNGLGLYDMTGNVSQWCQDWYSENYYKISPEKNPEGPKPDTIPLSKLEKSLRGGNFLFGAETAPTFNRGSGDAFVRSEIVGLRLVLPVSRDEKPASLVKRLPRAFDRNGNITDEAFNMMQRALPGEELTFDYSGKGSLTLTMGEKKYQLSGLRLFVSVAAHDKEEIAHIRKQLEDDNYHDKHGNMAVKEFDKIVSSGKDFDFTQITFGEEKSKSVEITSGTGKDRKIIATFSTIKALKTK